MGYELSSSNNVVSLAGTQSTWRVGVSDLYVGYQGAANQLIITNISEGSNSGTGAGGVYSRNGYVGYQSSSSNNLVLIGGTGSFWSCFNVASGLRDLYVGYAGPANQVIVSNIAPDTYVGFPEGMHSLHGYMGFMSSSRDNTVLITGSNSIWKSSSDLYVGNSGRNNQLIIKNGGAVNNSIGYLGFNASSSNNGVSVTGNGSAWRSSSDIYVGMSGRSNQLSIAAGGLVSNNFGYLGYNASSSNNSVLVAGTNSIWKNAADLSVGTNGMGNSLVISGGGQVLNVSGYIGGSVTSGSNSVLVTDAGSVWSNGPNFCIGYSGAGNSLVISNGGRVLSDNPFFSAVPGVCVGFNSSSSNNTVVIAGTGSIWSNDASESSVFIGYAGAGNSLVLKDGGQVCDFEGGVGHIPSSSNNSVLVTGAGSVWNNSDMGLINSGNSLVVSNFGLVKTFSGGNGGTNNSVRVVDNGVWQGKLLSIGWTGSSNSLVIAGGGVFATNFTVGFLANPAGNPPAACDNFVQLDSGSLIVTNAAHNATLQVEHGKLILNGGLLQVDRLVMTNGCGLFVRNGGTLIVGSLVLDPNLDADGDGIPNGWEQAYGLDPLNAADANVDSDGDGFSNLQEYLAGTDPTNNASNLRITSITPQGNSLLVIWTTGVGKTNALQAGGGAGYSTNGFSDIFVVTNTLGTITNYLDVSATTNVPARYYRVRLVP